MGGLRHPTHNDDSLSSFYGPFPDEMSLRQRVIRLAKQNPEIRKAVLPLLRKKASTNVQGDVTKAVKGFQRGVWQIENPIFHGLRKLLSARHATNVNTVEIRPVNLEAGTWSFRVYIFDSTDETAADPTTLLRLVEGVVDGVGNLMISKAGRHLWKVAGQFRAQPFVLTD